MAHEFNNKENILRRRKSDSNLLTHNNKRDRKTVLSQQQFSFKRQFSTLADRATDNKPADTFNDALEIKFHHSVGSMSISPASRDVVLAG
jgi:hypothetical protein